jgi:hypothetical protein
VLRKNTQQLEHLTREMKWNIVIITALNNNYKLGMCRQLGGNQKAGMFTFLTALTPQENSA